MKKLLAMLLAGVLLCMGVACFAGCERNTMRYLNMLVYEETQPYEHVAELDNWDTVKYAGTIPETPVITVPFTGVGRKYKIKLKSEGGGVMEARISGADIYTVSSSFSPADGGETQSNVNYVLEKGDYHITFSLKPSNALNVFPYRASIRVIVE